MSNVPAQTIVPHYIIKKIIAGFTKFSPETEISVLQKEVAWLEDEVGILRQTVVETNAKLAESHQLRRNLEEELSLMHRK